MPLLVKRASDLMSMYVGQNEKISPGFEYKCTDAPKTTKSMHIAMADLQLAHLWVVYPGTLRYSMAENITALPLGDLPDIRFGGN